VAGLPGRGGSVLQPASLSSFGGGGTKCRRWIALWNCVLCPSLARVPAGRVWTELTSPQEGNLGQKPQYRRLKGRPYNSPFITHHS